MMLSLKLIPAVLLVVATISVQGAPHGGLPPPDNLEDMAMSLVMEAMAQGMSEEEAVAYAEQKMIEAMLEDPSMLGPQPSEPEDSNDAPPPEVMMMFAEAMAQGMSGEEAAADVEQKMMDAMDVDQSEVVAMFAEAMAQGLSEEEAAALVEQKMMQKMMEALGVDGRNLQ
ncbi:uncharacterized protein LOC118414845 [Branchiostoma floridae]|uniref:Uncharacterized protein LOC118414845 n=1 Tax=Branchiostoma floridae TaxID=7739 RepID=A0A9J7L329_BRAFL|nr:uncharacterized protein LOC118414845 [Branchiostoma floridae]XP_035675004.1 uncharacterized protein LOC118414845 [Branchiostoma floridae]